MPPRAAARTFLALAEALGCGKSRYLEFQDPVKADGNKTRGEQSAAEATRNAAKIRDGGIESRTKEKANSNRGT